MASPVVTTASQLLCAHGGTVTVLPAGGRVRASGAEVATVASTFAVGSCPANPSPCGALQWLVPAQRVRSGGSPLVLSSSTGIGVGTGQPPTVVIADLRTSGT